MNHLEFAASESAALNPNSCERWLERLEEYLGHDLDGDQARDGYSLDYAGELFRTGFTIQEAGHIIAGWKREILNHG